MVAKKTAKSTKSADTSSSKKSVKKVTAKKVKLASSLARKRADKSKVRESRVTKRKAAAKPTETANKRLKEKVIGHAPQSARISHPQGPVQPVASKTVFAPKYSQDRRWLLVDANEQVVGRLAAQIANLLRGKHKASFTPNNDVGDFVVVINAEKVKFTSAKEESKEYYKHSGYIGGLKTTTPARLRRTYPERILWNAVKGMVPRTPLGRAQMKKLKVYAGEKHPHTAQAPVSWSLSYNSNT